MGERQGAVEDLVMASPTSFRGVPASKKRRSQLRAQECSDCHATASMVYGCCFRQEYAESDLQANDERSIA